MNTFGILQSQGNRGLELATYQSTSEYVRRASLDKFREQASMDVSKFSAC